MKPAWFPEWCGQTCVIVASGPSANRNDTDLARGRAKFIAINTSWQLAPWSDFLFACDFSWWKTYKGCREFEGKKLTGDRLASQTYKDINLVTLRRGDDRLILQPLGTLGWGSNSGFHALNLAVQFQCAKIILVGFDMTLEYGSHWHGDHPKELNQPGPNLVNRWKESIDNASETIKSLGIEVINISPISRLEKYPKMTMQEALSC